MTEQQIPKLAGSIVEHQAAFAALSTEDATWVIQNTKAAITLFNEAVINRNKPAADISASPKRIIPPSITDQLGMWKKLYADLFGSKNPGPVNPKLPADAEGFGWLVVVMEGLTIERVVKVLEKKIKVYRYINGDLDKAVPTNERIADKDYAVTVRDCIEADEELRNTSANQIAQRGLKTMTLLERLLLELFVFHFTGEHLDVKCYTICAGSRSSGGGVPHVYWRPADRRLYIDWCGVGNRGDDLAARAVQVVG